MFPATQAEPGLLEGEDRGEPENGSSGKRTAKKTRLEGDSDQGVSVETLGSNCRKDQASDSIRIRIRIRIKKVT